MSAMNSLNQNIADIFVQLKNDYDGACIGTLLAFVKDLQAVRAKYAPTDSTERVMLDMLKPVVKDMEECL